MSLGNMPFEPGNNLDICRENKYSDIPNILQTYIKNPNNNQLEGTEGIYNFENSFHTLDFTDNDGTEINNNQTVISPISEENVPQNDNDMNSVLNNLLNNQIGIGSTSKVEVENKLKIGDHETITIQETVTQPQLESIAPAKSEKFQFPSGRFAQNVIINIGHNHGTITLVKPKKELAKKDVDNPDGLAYRYDKQNGNCLVNAICLDKDIKENWQKIMEEFDISCDCLETPKDIYEFLYVNLSEYLKSSQMTRHQFLKKIHNSCDISHICGKF